MEFLRRIRWGCSKPDVRALFPGQVGIQHPSQDALGFETEVEGVPAAVVCYFRKTLMGAKLARVVLTAFASRPPDSVIQPIYAAIQARLVKAFGKPTTTIPCDLNDPPEFRQSEMLVWSDDVSVLTLSLRLVRDGVLKNTAPIGIGYGDVRHDPISKSLA
jgi:hypothetical protein